MTIIIGIVQSGKRQARLLGFPTANIMCNLPLPEGVYGAFTRLTENFFEKEFASIAYLKDGILEVHLMNVELDLYGITLEVHLKAFVRPPQPYISAEHMQQQIQKDLLWLAYASI